MSRWNRQWYKGIMRTRVVGAVVALLLVGCGETVTNHIDALRESGARYTHSMLPSPERLAEIYREPAGSTSLRSQLRRNEHARAIFDAGEGAVPELVLLLDDAERRTLAAFFLAEIGGEQTASALLGQWRGLRGRVQEKIVYHKVGASVMKGRRYEGVDGKYYNELLHALCYTGRPVSAAVAADTRAAMDESERLRAAGEDLRRKETRQEATDEIELRWDIEPVETACEGLMILAMVGAPEAPALYTRALGSPIRAFQWKGIHNVVFIGEGAKQTLPALGALLDDQQSREFVIEQLAFILDQGSPPSPDWPASPLTEEEQEAVARRYKQRLRELGHLR